MDRGQTQKGHKGKGHSLHLLENMIIYKIDMTIKHVTAGRQVGFRGGSNS